MAQSNFEERIDTYEIESTNVMTGDRDRSRYLYYQLKMSMAKAKQIDIIVSFLMESGVRMLLNDMKRALDRGVKIRILTGNYLGITQPSALYLIKSELGDRVDLRLYNETSRSFHPKSYIFHYESSNEIYIGSSNISKSALTSGIEWNYRFSDTLDKKNYELFYATFEDLFLNHSIIIDDEELKRYSKAWKKPAVSRDLAKYDATEDGEDRNAENVRMLYRPRGAQIEALYNVELRTDRTVIDICKPYKNKILADRIRKINDSISDINFVPFYSGEKVTAMLWYAETNFLGTVLDKDIKGIRIRQGNILIGDENTLRKCYKEERFNSWMVGELLVFNEDIIPNTRRDDYEKNSAYKELLSQFTEWANEMSRQIRHRSYERSLTQSDKKFLADESVTDVDGVDISLGTELDSYDMDDSDSVANTDLLSKLSLLMDMGKKKTKYNVLNLNSKFTVDQKQTLEHVFDALYAKYTNAKANDIIQTIIDSF